MSYKDEAQAISDARRFEKKRPLIKAHHNGTGVVVCIGEEDAKFSPDEARTFASMIVAAALDAEHAEFEGDIPF